MLGSRTSYTTKITSNIHRHSILLSCCVDLIVVLRIRQAQRRPSEVQGAVTMQGYLKKKSVSCTRPTPLAIRPVAADWPLLAHATSLAAVSARLPRLPRVDQSTGLKKSWQSRHFQLAGHYLRYAQDDESGNEIKGTISLKALVAVEIRPVPGGTGEESEMCLNFRACAAEPRAHTIVFRAASNRCSNWDAAFRTLIEHQNETRDRSGSSAIAPIAEQGEAADSRSSAVAAAAAAAAVGTVGVDATKPPSIEGWLSKRAIKSGRNWRKR